MRRDEAHADSNNYVYLIGADRLSTDLHNICLAANDKYTQLNLDFKYNDPWILIISMRRSDHYNFAKNGVPSVFLLTGSCRLPQKNWYARQNQYDALAKEHN
jgi:Zn-dependent M28 family amino/carboxypeptidase